VSVTVLPRFLTVSELARHAGVSDWLIRQEIANGNLTSRRIGRVVRILDEEAARWMRGDPS
jgi:excisionase family DNA binding protein